MALSSGRPTGRPAPISINQVLTAVQIVSALGNINWKGIKAMYLGIASFFGGLFGRAKSFVGNPALKEYWGRALLIILAAIIAGWVVYDWRKQAVEATEAKAALAVSVAEVQVLRTKVAADEAARNARGELLVELAEKNDKAMDELAVAVDKNPEWSNQELPKELRDALRRR